MKIKLYPKKGAAFIHKCTVSIICFGERVIHMTSFKAAASLLPLRLCGELLILPEKVRSSAEEIRLRSGQSISISADGIETDYVTDYKISSEDLQTVLEKATGASVHTVENSLSSGYVSVKGGLRVGLCGTAIMKGDRLCGVRRLSSVAVRIPHEVKDCAAAQAKELMGLGFPSALIISPPGFGKTTCMRALIRCASESGMRVSVADERGELAAVWDGQSQFELGPHTDVMTAAPKAQAAMLLLRAMNPQILAMDEISAQEDAEAILEAAGCGVKLLATAHAKDLEEMRSRPIYRKLLNEGIFKYALIIGRSFVGRTYTLKELS